MAKLKICKIVIGLFFLFYVFDLAFGAPLKVVTTLPPAEYLIRSIALGAIDLDSSSLIKGNIDPHHYSPRPSDIEKISTSKIFVTTGLDFESALEERVKAAASNVVVIRLNFSEAHGWLAPSQVILSIDQLALELIKIAPDKSGKLTSNADNLKKRFIALSTAIKDRLAPFKGGTFFVYHPAFGAFAKEFELKERFLEREGRSPSPKFAESFIEEAKSSKNTILIMQPQFESRSAEIVAKKIGATLEEFNDLSYDLYQSIEGLSFLLLKIFTTKSS